ncbi:MAG TPA: OmpA family protein [Vineibacter sp.]|nr:OmpA family protein [Vineibacter sp.]
MSRSMGAALAVLAIIGAALAIWTAPGTSVGDAAKAELARVSAARDAADSALAAARGEIERAAAAAVAAKAEADRAVAAAREEAERKLVAAQADANKAIAAAKVEAETAAGTASSGRIAALRAEAEQAVAAARSDAEKTAAALRDQLSQCQAAVATKKPDSESGRCAAGTTAPATGPVAAADIGRELSASGSIALYGIQFDSGSAKLTAESRSSIDELAKLMKDDADLKLLIVGHTDNTGDFTTNRNLSEQRAQAVVTDLVTRAGADRTRLSSAGIADLAPLSTNDTDAGRARNRRVEVVKR